MRLDIYTIKPKLGYKLDGSSLVECNDVAPPEVCPTSMVYAASPGGRHIPLPFIQYSSYATLERAPMATLGAKHSGHVCHFRAMSSRSKLSLPDESLEVWEWPTPRGSSIDDWSTDVSSFSSPASVF